ncbi:HK97 gp10 family phage protein [Bacillus safensis]|uniref:HK97-gp10 family putative phage morphogenesis protein n=1 Tax=Bacillus TaxID=1386 RepID=UPI0011A478A4|nr:MULTISPECIES: HK97-gp10 family putative phage morphogenesis protein [Bacillus]MCY7585514.1 HK97 gp10 family phage protein [Bacillus safensis]MCY7586949.1 HK97 gp10 family phage protein [Bacillus safensis]MCY7610044.1 HK97 gp10 family phage protein [Bacillus safensis]
MAEVSGKWAKQMAKTVEKFERKVIDRAKQVVTETAELIYSHAVINAPTSMIDGGNLKNSIEVEYRDEGLKAIITVGADYAVYVEYGTGIYAEEGGGRQTPWVYYDEKLGRWVMTRGMRAQPFFNPAVEEGMRHFAREMQ